MICVNNRWFVKMENYVKIFLWDMEGLRPFEIVICDARCLSPSNCDLLVFVYYRLVGIYAPWITPGRDWDNYLLYQTQNSWPLQNKELINAPFTTRFGGLTENTSPMTLKAAASNK